MIQGCWLLGALDNKGLGAVDGQGAADTKRWWDDMLEDLEMT